MAFIAPIIAAVAGAGASVAGAAAAIAPTAGLLSAGAGVVSAARGFTAGGGPKVPSLLETPASPNALSIEAAQKQNVLRAAQARTKSILTSPLGVTNPAPVKRKLLLGE